MDVRHSADLDPLGRDIWSSRYRAPGEADLADSWARVADAVAAAEPVESRERWADQFREAMEGFRFLPGGRILASAGVADGGTLFSCFVMGRLSDAPGALDCALAESEATLRAGGGIGIDLTPLGLGVVEALERWDAMCRRVSDAGRRRGAMMACLAIDHPEIEAFIEAKRRPGLSCFNLSVLVPDAFMLSLDREPRARALWEGLMRAAYDTAEPGVIFVDRVNRDNNLGYRETISAANPCAEQMLPAYGACLLGSINLGRLVSRPFEPDAALDEEALARLADIGVRFLDDAIDVSAFPLPEQEAEEKTTRRIGLGVTGLADAFAFCGVEYGSPESAALTRRWLGVIKRAAYRASAVLAGEKGSFPGYSTAILSRPNLTALDPDTRAPIEPHGLRNGCLTCIAPTGTISLLAGGASSGIEPIFAPRHVRRVRLADGAEDRQVEAYAARVWRSKRGEAQFPYATTAELTPGAHLAVLAAAQPLVDSGVSKTVNCPADLPFDVFDELYAQAWRMGCKSLSAFRPNTIRGAVLRATADAARACA